MVLRKSIAMSWLKRLFPFLKPKKKEDVLSGIEDFPPLNIQKLNENVSSELFNEGRTPPKKEDNQNQS